MSMLCVCLSVCECVRAWVRVRVCVRACACVRRGFRSGRGTAQVALTARKPSLMDAERWICPRDRRRCPASAERQDPAPGGGGGCHGVGVISRCAAVGVVSGESR